MAIPLSIDGILETRSGRPYTTARSTPIIQLSLRNPGESGARSLHLYLRSNLKAPIRFEERPLIILTMRVWSLFRQVKSVYIKQKLF